ncbi:MAG: SusC/RagA family TonB-linked outer membrane protein, partial [Parapedobacter sp.]
MLSSALTSGAITVSPLNLVVQQTVSGRVIGTDGLPLPGVSISVVGSEAATSTNEAGNYSISVQTGATLRFSMIGYASQDIVVSGATLNVTLEASGQSLDEVVVVGYGTMKRSDLTGAVVTADLEAFKEAPNTNILQSIKGTVPGLQIGQTNQAGAEPSIAVRGRNTINGNTAVLIVLDGIIYNGRIGDVNPADIESVNILKDASSKAIYGAQAANGVMLITTRGGKKGKPTISYSTYLASQTPTSDMRLRNAEEKKQIIRDIYYQNSYLAPDYTQPNPDWDFSDTELVPENVRGIEDGTDYDWWGALTNPGFITDHALTIGGGTEKTSYYLSGGFTKQRGFLMNDNYKRNTARINVSTEISEWLTVGANTFGAFTDYSGIYPNMGAMKLTSPFVTPKDENGEYIIYPTGATNIINPF